MLIKLLNVFCLAAVFHEAMREAFQSKVQHPRKAMSLFLKAGKGVFDAFVFIGIKTVLKYGGGVVILMSGSPGYRALA